MGDDLLRVSDAARIYDVREDTVRDWCRKGVIPHTRVGPPPGQIRLRRSDMERTVTPDDHDK